eukprot:Clim_evm14s141 gene=Clim_evmTU14s141
MPAFTTCTGSLQIYNYADIPQGTVSAPDMLSSTYHRQSSWTYPSPNTSLNIEVSAYGSSDQFEVQSLNIMIDNNQGGLKADIEYYALGGDEEECVVKINSIAAISDTDVFDTPGIVTVYGNAMVNSDGGRYSAISSCLASEWLLNGGCPGVPMLAQDGGINTPTGFVQFHNYNLLPAGTIYESPDSISLYQENAVPFDSGISTATLDIDGSACNLEDQTLTLVFDNKMGSLTFDVEYSENSYGMCQPIIRQASTTGEAVSSDTVVVFSFPMYLNGERQPPVSVISTCTQRFYSEHSYCPDVPPYHQAGGLHIPPSVPEHKSLV